MVDSKCTTIKTQDSLPDGTTAKQYTVDDQANLVLSEFVEASSDPTAGSMTTGQKIVSTSSGDFFYKSATGLYTIDGAYVAD